MEMNNTTGRKFARWLGVSHWVGSDLYYWLLLLPSGKVIARTTVQHVMREDILNKDVRRNVEAFDRNVEERLNDQGFMDQDPNATFFLPDEDVICRTGGVTTTPAAKKGGDMLTPDALEANDVDDEVLDKYLNTELILDMGTGAKRQGCVIKRVKGTTGQPIGRGHTNPLFDTRE
jgi:hypothetical protein